MTHEGYAKTAKETLAYHHENSPWAQRPPEQQPRPWGSRKAQLPILAPGFFPPSSQHKLYFLCTSAKWQYHCVVVWKIQCVKCSICVGMRGRKLSLGQASGDWRTNGLKTDRVAGCGQSFGDKRWQFTWTLFNGLILPPIDNANSVSLWLPRVLCGFVYMFPEGHLITYFIELI